MISYIKNSLILFVFLLGPIVAVYSQETIGYRFFGDNYTISEEKEGALDLSIDNLSFLKNNESDGDIKDGYTLPGFRFQPHVIYYPSSIVKLEAGISLLRFWGADKYPCYSYQNIAEWQSDDYQYGVHVLPFFRAQIQPIKQINVVLGMLYGGSNHRIIEPLYNPELNLTADPECGAQFLYDSRIAHGDVWVNWESFTFKNDTHNEAFTLGTSAALNITPENSFFHLSLPVQLLAIHRGGEIDTINSRLTTMVNSTAGLNFRFNTNRFLKNISLQVMGADYNALKGDDLFYTSGWAFYSNLSASLWNINLKVSYWKSSDFITLFGNPVYGNISQSIEERVFPKLNIWNGGLAYEQQFGNGFSLGANMDFYYNPNLVAYYTENYDKNYPSKVSQSWNFSFGVYLRINPSITIKNKIFS